MKRIPVHLLHEAEIAINSHVPVGDVARRLGVEVDELRTQLGMPLWKEVPADADGFDLFRVDELDAVL